MFKSGVGPCYILVALKCMKDLELGQCLLKYVNVQGNQYPEGSETLPAYKYESCNLLE